MGVLATFYVAYLMHEAEITADVRREAAKRSNFLLRLLSCPVCCSFWAGILVWLLGGNARPLAYAGGSAFAYKLWGKLNDR